MKNLKILFLGTPDFVKPIKDVLAQHFILVDSLKEADPDLIGADLTVVAAYGRILTKNEVNTPKYGAINIHPSLLPKYRGPSPIQQAILNGDKISGISIIKMDSQVDHGPIIYQEEIELCDNDNFDTLSKKIFRRSAEVLPKIIDDFIKNKITLIKQNDAAATFCDKLTRESGYFPVNNPPDPKKLDRMIRAYYPWPGVWTKWSFDSAQVRLNRTQDKNNKIVKFLPSACHPRSNRGSINNNLVDSRFRGNDKFLIQMEGKKAISFKDFLNGYPNFPVKQILAPGG